MESRAIAEGIGVLRRNDLYHLISLFGDREGADEDDVLALLALAPRVHEAYQGEFRVELKRESIVWKDYESLLWAMGESIRQVLRRKRRLRGSERIWQEVRGICVCDGYGKGRESFVMLLGQYGGQTQSATLAGLLDDPDVAGHALYALRLLKSPAGAFAARRFLSHSKPWIRQEARKYLAKIGVGTQPNLALQRTRSARH